MFCLCDITDCDEISQVFPFHTYIHTGHWKWQRCEVRDIPFVIQPHFVLLQYGIIIPVTTVKHLPRQSWVTVERKRSHSLCTHVLAYSYWCFIRQKNNCRQSICPNDFQCSLLAPVAMGLPASDTHLILPTNQTVNYKYYLKFGSLKLSLHNSRTLVPNVAGMHSLWNSPTYIPTHY